MSFSLRGFNADRRGSAQELEFDESTAHDLADE